MNWIFTQFIIKVSSKQTIPTKALFLRSNRIIIVFIWDQFNFKIKCVSKKGFEETQGFKGYVMLGQVTLSQVFYPKRFRKEKKVEKYCPIKTHMDVQTLKDIFDYFILKLK